jgi:hypothetical protein
LGCVLGGQCEGGQCEASPCEAVGDDIKLTFYPGFVVRKCIRKALEVLIFVVQAVLVDFGDAKHMSSEEFWPILVLFL